MNIDEWKASLKEKGYTDEQIYELFPQAETQEAKTQQPPSIDPQIIVSIIANIAGLIDKHLERKHKPDSKRLYVYFGIILLLLAALGFMCYVQYIDKVSASTLLASIIGYSIGQYQKEDGE